MSITTRSPRIIDFTLKATGPEVGPGSYNLPELITTPYDSPYPFNTTAARFKDNPNENPGPSDYSPIIPTLSIHGGSATMKSRSPRKSWDILNNPSPADYQHIHDWSRGPEKGSPSLRQQMSSRSPRDGTIINKEYHVSSSADFDTRFPYNRGITIPKTSRTYKKPWITPGPSDYNVLPPRKISPNKSPSFMTSSDRDIFKTPDWVVDYDGLSQTEWKLPSSGAPFGSRQKKQNFWGKSDTPAPCAYNVQQDRTFSTSAAPFNSGSARQGLWDGNSNPGPADYKIEHKRRYRDTNSCPFFQRSERFTPYKADYDACPAQYDIDMEDRVKEEKLRQTPSPPFKAVYDRDPYRVTTKTPGVGSYNITSQRSHRLKHCIDGSERIKPNTIFGQPISQTPGPGKYEDAPAYRISGGTIAREGRRRPPFPGPEETPGPVAYATTSSLFKPSLNVTYSTGKL